MITPNPIEVKMYVSYGVINRSYTYYSWGTELLFLIEKAEADLVPTGWDLHYFKNKQIGAAYKRLALIIEVGEYLQFLWR